MKMTAESAGCDIKFFTLDHTIDVFSRKTPKKSILLVVHDPAAVRKLVEGGVPCERYADEDGRPDFCRCPACCVVSGHVLCSSPAPARIPLWQMGGLKVPLTNQSGSPVGRRVVEKNGRAKI